MALTNHKSLLERVRTCVESATRQAGDLPTVCQLKDTVRFLVNMHRVVVRVLIKAQP